MTASKHKMTAWRPGRSLTRAVLALSAVGALLIGCTWALNDSAGIAELQVTIPPQEDSVGALQVTEDTELFVHIIEADRFEALYAEAEDVQLEPNGTPPENAKHLQAEQLRISRDEYLSARDDTGVLQTSRFAWFFGQGAQDGISLSFRDLKPDTEYILYAIQGERFEEEGFFGQYWGVAQQEEVGGPIVLNSREDRTVTLRLNDELRLAGVESDYGMFFLNYGSLPYEPPLPPEELEPRDFDFAIYEGEGAALELSYTAINGITDENAWFEVSFNEAFVSFEDTEIEDDLFPEEDFSLIFTGFYDSNENGNVPDLIVGFVEEPGVTEPSGAYEWPDQPYDPENPQPPEPGSVFFVVIEDPDLGRSYELSYFGDQESGVPPAGIVTLGSATFAALPSQGGQFTLTISGQGAIVDGEFVSEADIVVSDFSFTYGDDITDEVFFGDFDAENESEFEIGDFQIGDIGPAGGRIFYEDEANDFWWTYLEAAPENWFDGGDPNLTWGPNDVWLSDLGYETDAFGGQSVPGNGMSNTAEILRALTDGVITEAPAVAVAVDYEVEGFSDWFLPAASELELMYENLRLLELGGFTADIYWSSGESDASEGTEAYGYDFDNGFVVSGAEVNKQQANLVRPVHAH